MRNLLRALAIATLGAALASHAAAQTAPAQPTARVKPGFQGYWLGVDPVDGGDARRSLIQREDGKFALAARDTVLTLCGGTEHGFASFDDGELVGRNVLQSNTLTIQCFNNGASVVLHVRYELLGKGLMLEHTTRPDGSLVSDIVFHKVSQD
jgi:hypothetical protein